MGRLPSRPPRRRRTDRIRVTWQIHGSPQIRGAAGWNAPRSGELGEIVHALAGVLGGLLLGKGSIIDVAQESAATIVFGGTFGAVMVTTPLPVVLRTMSGLKNSFFEQAISASASIKLLIRYVAQARKNGIVSLETEAASISDRFLSKALNLAVDGTDLRELCKMMELDIALAEQAGEAKAKVWEAARGYARTVGIIGAVMGVLQVMKHLEAQQYTRWGAAGLAGLPLARAQTRVAETRELLEWARATWSRARTEIAGQLLRLDRVSRYQSPGPAPRFQLPLEA